MIVLGVDGGGTKSHALALDETGNILGIGVSGESNYQIIGLEQTADTLADVTRQALGSKRADMAVFCLAGCDIDLDHTRLSRCITDLAVTKNFSCYNDAFAALRAGTPHPFGVAVICGTGFNACGIAPDGRQARLHSLGPITGDWGGGYTLGEAAIGAVYRAAERRGPPTLLTDLLIRALHIPDLESLTYKLIDDQISRTDISAVAVLVFEAAERGDPIARALIERQSDEIVIAAQAMMSQLDLADQTLDVVLSGGVIKGQGTLLIDRVTAQLARSHPKAQVTRLRVPPVIGAALLAFDALHIPAPAMNVPDF